MRKAADAFRSIGEVSKLIGVPPHVLRYWETQFPQLSPVKRADGRRYYRPEDLHLAAGLCELLREEGMTTRGAARLIAKDKGASLRARGLARLPERFRGDAEIVDGTVMGHADAPAIETAPAGKAASAGNGMADVPATAAPGHALPLAAVPVAPAAESEASEPPMEVPVETPRPTLTPTGGVTTPPPSTATPDLPLFPGLALAAPPPGVWLPRLAASAEGLRAMTPPRRVPVQMQHLRDRIASLIDPDA